ncbi:MAG: hypothetical protein B7X02_01120 [Rhodospirillales bacterium 12-54-5]|nr:MAG: hypothetical protein B7X02_01120 [Rhodospirillales bacterium 12-54-5]
MTQPKQSAPLNPINWALQQGMLGAKQTTLNPSLTAMGPNRYLTRDDFIKMIGVALLLHATVIGIASLFHDDRVTDIPVRALSFKIGDTEHMTVSAPARIAVPAPAPAPVAAPAQPQRVEAPTPPPIWQKNAAPPRISPQVVKIPTQPQSLPFTPPRSRQHPLENPAPLAPLPPSQQPSPTAQAAPAPASPPLAALPDPNLLSQPAVAPNPQRFVRETTAPQAAAAPTAAQAAETVRARYEQQISAWVARHYPADTRGLQGRIVVRVRIDRTGNVRYYGVEESSGNAASDNAATDMIRRANPMPAVPDDYPAGSLIDFIIPISFKASS